LTRLTTDPDVDIAPIWTSDGRRIIFASGRLGGVMNLWWQAADSTATAERLTTSPDRQAASSVTPDGEVLFDDQAPSTGVDIMRLPLRGDRHPVVILQTKANEHNAIVSRDGHWMAYESDSSGHAEIYVRPSRFEGAGFTSDCLRGWFPAETREDHWLFDGWQSARDQLEAAGIRLHHVYFVGLCTSEHAEFFCSYRRDGTKAGRMAAAVRLASQ